MKRILATILILDILAVSLLVFASNPAYAAATPILPTSPNSTVNSPTALTSQSPITAKGGCSQSSQLSPWLDASINDAFYLEQNGIKAYAKKFLKDFVVGFLEGLIGTNVPVQDQATGTADQALLTYFQVRDMRDNVVARCLARLQLDNITNNISTVIQSRGRDGGPSFVTNWRAFQTNAQYRGENIFRAMLSTSNLCNTFSNDLKKSFGLKPTDKISLTGANTRTDSLTPFSVQINCTLPKGFTPDKFQSWDATALQAQPQNNLYGATLLAQDQINLQRSLEQSSDVNQAIAGNTYTGVSGNGKNDSCKITGFGGTCIVYKDIKTTGEYLANSAAATINAQFNWLTSAQGLNTIIEDVTQSMINRLFDQSNNTGGTIATNPVLTIPGGSYTPVPPIPPGGTPLPATCSSVCQQSESDCVSSCGGDQDCNNSCEQTLNECLNECSSQTPFPTVPPGPTPISTTNPPAPGGGVDLGSATINNSAGDVASWPQTATITNVDLMNGKIDFNKRDASTGWPWQTFEGQITSPGNGIFYTAWMFIYQNGKWVGSGFGQCYDRNIGDPPCLKPDGSLASWGLGALWYANDRWPDMYGHVLHSGEQVGIMVTAGNERGGTATAVKERSNVFMITLP